LKLFLLEVFHYFTIILITSNISLKCEYDIKEIQIWYKIPKNLSPYFRSKHSHISVLMRYVNKPLLFYYRFSVVARLTSSLQSNCLSLLKLQTPGIIDIRLHSQVRLSIFYQECLGLETFLIWNFFLRYLQTHNEISWGGDPNVITKFIIFYTCSLKLILCNILMQLCFDGEPSCVFRYSIFHLQCPVGFQKVLDFVKIQIFRFSDYTDSTCFCIFYENMCTHTYLRPWVFVCVLFI
jgi:hypothetical protein